jgi:hypothetical protein
MFSQSGVMGDGCSVRESILLQYNMLCLDVYRKGTQLA